MSKGFVVTLVTIFSICVLCAAVYFLGVTASKQPLIMFGVVDNSGKTIVPVKYKLTSYIDDNNFFVSKNDKGFIYNIETKKLKPTEYSFIAKASDNLYSVIKNNHSGLVDKNYKVVIPIKYSNVSVDNNIIRAFTYGGDNNISLFDLKGKKILQTTSHNFIYYKNESAVVTRSNKDKGKYYTIDETGVKLLPTNYDKFVSISEGLAVFKKGDKCGVVSLKTGKEIVPPIYGHINVFQNGYAVVSDKDITKIGGNGTVRRGVIDRNGKLVIPLSNNYIGNFSEGLLSIYKGNKAGYMDINRKEVIPLKYASANEFSEGLAAVENDKNEWGFIDKTGKQIVPFTYKHVEPFHKGYAVVIKYNNNFINKSIGKGINNLMNKSDSSDLSDSFSFEGSGVIDKTGKEVVPFKYTLVYLNEVDPFSISDYINKSDNKYFIVCKINKFAFFGRLLGFKDPDDLN